MLSSSNLIGFLLTKDYNKARAFFEAKLGFQFVSLDQFALVMQAGAHMIRISKVPDFTPARNTVLGWDVQDIEAVVSWLKQRGVVFDAQHGLRRFGAACCLRRGWLARILAGFVAVGPDSSVVPVSL